MHAPSNAGTFHHRWAHPWWLSVVVRGIGLLFLAAGLAKVPMLGAFAQTIGALTQSGGFALAAAGAVVAVETACGGALLLCRRVRLAAGVLTLLTGVFLLILYRAVAGGHPLVCNCFGVLGVHLSNRAEFLLDLGLFNLLLLVLAFWPSGRIAWRFAGRAILFALAVAAVVGLEGYLLLRPPGRAEAHERLRISAENLRSYLPEARQKAGMPASPAGPEGASGPTMMFFLRFEDFTCPLCFEDFLSLADSLALRGAPALEGRIWALLKAGGAERLEGSGRLERWADETGLRFPIRMVPDSVFDAAGVRKSMVTVLSDAGHPVFAGEFPMGQERRSEALRLLFGTDAVPGD